MVVVAAICIAALAAPFAMKRFKTSGGKDSKVSSTIVSAEAAQGSITNTISGSGTLSLPDAQDIVVPVGITIDKVLVESGDIVKEGQVLATVNQTSVASAISEIQSSIEKVDDELEEISDDTSKKTVRAAVSGRIKGMHISIGSDAGSVVKEQGSLLCISVDGKMAVDLETNANVSAGDSVKVTLSSGTTVEGSVESAAGSAITVTITDNGPASGDEVRVAASNGVTLGKGKLYVHQPYLLMDTAGTVSDIYVSENEKVGQDDKLYRLKGVIDEAAKNELVAKRADLAKALTQMLSIQASGQIVADQAGIIVDVNVAEGEEITKSTQGNSSGGSDSSGSSDLSGFTGSVGTAENTYSFVDTGVDSDNTIPVQGTSEKVTSLGSGSDRLTITGRTILTLASSDVWAKDSSGTQEDTSKNEADSYSDTWTEKGSEDNSSNQNNDTVQENEASAIDPVIVDTSQSYTDQDKDEASNAADGDQGSEASGGNGGNESSGQEEPGRETEAGQIPESEKEQAQGSEKEQAPESEKEQTPESETDQTVYGERLINLPVTAPEAGAAPMTTAQLEEAMKKEGSPFEVKELTWYCEGKAMNSGDVFEGGKSYEARITLSANRETAYQYMDKNGNIQVKAAGPESAEAEYEERNEKLSVSLLYKVDADSSGAGNNTAQNPSASSNGTGQQENPGGNTNSSTAQNGNAASASPASSKSGNSNSSNYPSSSSAKSSGSGSSGSSPSTGTVQTAGSSQTSTAASDSQLYSMYETAGFTITASDSMQVQISVTELDILSVEAGQAVSVQLDAIDGQSFEGIVEKTADSGTNNGGSTKYAVNISIPRDKKMLEGMSATAVITVGSAENVVTIPSDALQERGGSTFVYTSDENGELGGKTEVETGLSNGTLVEIVSGLTQGQTVYYRQLAGTDISSGSSNQQNVFPGGGSAGFPGGGSGGFPSGGTGGFPGGSGGSSGGGSGRPSR